MHPVIEREQLSPNVVRLVVEAPRIAKVRRPGQFVIVRKGPGAERIPLTIADNDPEAGTITLMIQAIGVSTTELTSLQVGDAIQDVAGPLGRETDLIESGHAVCVGGGVGTAVLLPIVRALADNGIHVTSVIGGRSKEWVILEPELRACGDVVVCTDDGSYGRHGFVTEALKDLLDAGGVDAVYAIGPVPMMKAVSAMTEPYGVADHRLPQRDHGRRDRHVRRLPRDGWRPDQVRVRRRPRVRRAQGELPGARRPPHHVPQLRAGRACPPGGRDGEGRLRDNRGESMTEPASPVPADEDGATAPTTPLTNKERMQIDRVAMPEQAGAARAQNFEEVNLGLTYQLAMLEAERCIQCPKPFCVDGCPVRVDVPRFIKFLREGNMPAAAESLLGDNALPCVTGRVCPQETQCEGVCIRVKKGNPVAIGYLERFVADWAQANIDQLPKAHPTKTGKKVGIVGSGPAGLTAAGELVAPRP